MIAEIIDALIKEDSTQKRTSSFYAESTLDPECFDINVKGIGSINLPIDQSTLSKLLEISSKAKFGYREETLIDTDIRDAQEISAENLHIKYTESVVIEMLQGLQHKLGLPVTAKLTLHLHNMLIYGPNQFFKLHQDSEKIAGMVASLVVVLPSPHIGGDLLINHQDTTYTFVSQNLNETKVKCICFYADCEHEVKKVTQGYRLALTYNVVLEPEVIQLENYENKRLEQAVKDYFDKKDTIGDEPISLTYFLDHSYSEHSLNWDLLKGTDRENALAFRHAAKKLKLTPYLALAEYHESWLTDGNERAPNLEELIDSEADLYFWVNEANQEQNYGKFRISLKDVCLTKEIKEFTPFNFEIEGWMGNYGNTADYWYRRAAIVLWRETDKVLLSFKFTYLSALEQLAELTAIPGNEKQVSILIKEVGKYMIPSINVRQQSEVAIQCFRFLAKIAVYVKDETVAELLLLPFEMTIITSDTAESIADLYKLYHLSWVLKMMNKWSEENKQIHWRLSNVNLDLYQLCIKLQDLEVEQLCIDFILQYHTSVLIKNTKSSDHHELSFLRESNSKRQALTKNRMVACYLFDDDTLITSLSNTLILYERLYSLIDLTDLVLFIREFVPRNHLHRYRLLQEHTTQKIKEELGLGLRAVDDWSINEKLSCMCDDCKTATEFLVSKNMTRKIWPLAASYRDHVQRKIKHEDLPVDFEVQKTGSPHKLIMTKRQTLYKIAKERFDCLQSCYKKLTQHTPPTDKRKSGF